MGYIHPPDKKETLHMKSTYTAVHFFFTELRQSLGAGFFMGILAGIVCIVLDCGTGLTSLQESTVQDYIGTLFPYGFYGTFVFAPLMSIPYGMGYYRDRNSGILRLLIMRTGKSAYCGAKVGVTFISSFLAGSISMTLCVVVLQLFGPLMTGVVAEDLKGAPFMVLVSTGHYVFYYIIFIFLMGLWCGLHGVAVLFLSAWIAKGYICIAAVVTFGYAATVILNVLGVGIDYRLNSWFSVRCSPFMDWVTFGLCIGITVLGVWLLKYAFSEKVKKNLANE